MSENVTGYVELDAARCGVSDHLKQCIGEVLTCLEEQEQGERKDGPIKVTITLTFEAQKDGCIVETASKVAAPSRCAAKGVFAQVSRGKLLVPEMVQDELFRDHKYQEDC